MNKLLILLLFFVGFQANAMEKKEARGWDILMENLTDDLNHRQNVYVDRYESLLAKEESDSLNKKEKIELKSLKKFFKKNPSLLKKGSLKKKISQ